MTSRRIARLGLLLALLPAARGAEDFFDRLDEALTVSSFDDRVRTRLSGTLDLEGYALSQPSPGLLYTPGHSLFNPRLSTFLDVQLGDQFYAFAQARADRGFDPSHEKPEARLDEYAVRFTPSRDGRFNVQVGKFATVVGNWVSRHGSWDNPFITAPLPYEHLTGVWDLAPPRSGIQLQNWAHVLPTSSPVIEYAEKPRRTPVIWGPSYTSGAAVFGRVGNFDYAAELKNAALSSHPDAWPHDNQWAHPTVSGRLGYRPNAMWNLGFSASDGAYLRPSADPLLPPGQNRGDYRETVLAQDVAFAWHHVQLWGEIYHARFTIPRVGRADTTAYYVEAKYKFTPQFFGAVRWNQQLFATIPNGAGGRTAWGREVWRIDLAPTYRFTPQTQFKLQSSLLHDPSGPHRHSLTHAAQFTLRF